MYYRNHKYRMAFLVLPVFFFIGVNIMVGSDTNLEKYLPQTVKGWKISEEDQHFDQRTLYNYINGGAELYLSYGFVKLISRTYEMSNQPKITVDIFDMNTPQNAFGVFSHSREKEDGQFGQGSQYSFGLLLFWKSQFYISILASPETEESKEAVFHLAQIIDDSIQEEGQLPEIMNFLPAKSLIKESIKYFRHHVWLNSYYFISDQNIFHIDQETEAILAKYNIEDHKPILLLIKYPSKEKSNRAYSDFIKYFVPDLENTGVSQIEDSTWVGCTREENMVIAVFNASTENVALELLNEVVTKSD